MKQWENHLTDLPHYNILIATPGRLIHNAYVKSLVDTTRWLETQGLTYKFLNSASSLVAHARELTALDRQESNWDTNEIGSGDYTYDRIVWIDSDISWTIDAFAKLISSEHQIISGMYYTNIGDMSVSVSVFAPDGISPVNCKELDFFMIDEPIEVFGVGFGFVSMKSGVFEGMQRPWFRIERINHPTKGLVIDIGEDYSWCMNARRAQFKVMLDPTIKVTHHKESAWHLR